MSKKYFYANSEQNNYKDVFTFKNLRTGEAWDATYENKSTGFIMKKAEYCQQCILGRSIPEQFKFDDLKEGDKIEITWDTVHGGKTFRTIIGAFKY